MYAVLAGTGGLHGVKIYCMHVPVSGTPYEPIYTDSPPKQV